MLKTRFPLAPCNKSVRCSKPFRSHKLPKQQDFTGDLKKLKGSKNEYRLRVGNYRVLFQLEGKRLVAYTVGPRKDIYQ